MASAKRIEQVLKSLGFRRVKGPSSGHEFWRDGQNRQVKPVLRKKEVHTRTLYVLAQELEGLGVIKKVDFRNAVKGVR